MRTFVIGVLLLYGAYYYVSRKFEFQDTFTYAQKHKDASWSGPVEYYVGLVYYQRSDFPKAQESFTRLLEEHPTDYHSARALVMLGDSAEYNHDWKAAADALSKYIEQYPNGKEIELVRQRLDLLKYQHGNQL